MKSLFTLLVLSALVAFGGAFLGKWKIPGVENFPTAESIQARLQAQPDMDPVEDIAGRRMQQGGQSQSPAGYFATGVESASANRNQQLRNASKKMGVE
jgi:hypothetical protein